jgi:hypothetical protein
MEFTDLVGRELISVRLCRTEIHKAWIDARSPSIATYYVNLELASSPSAQVQPCEVQVPNSYPSLGIELREWSDSPAIQRAPDGAEFAVERLAEATRFLPAFLTDVRLWDSLGEGPVSAVDLVLSTGLTLTVRHVYPPMMLGIDVFPEGRHEL